MTEDKQLRIAALLALAQVQAAAAAPHMAEFAVDDQRELRIAAGFAKHLAGSTTEAFQALIEVAENQNDEVIEDTMLDMAKVIMPLLLRTIRDQQATDEARVTCARVYAQLHPSDWSAILEGLADERLGQDFYEAILAGWEFDENFFRKSWWLCAATAHPLLLKPTCCKSPTTSHQNWVLEVTEMSGLDRSQSCDTFVRLLILRRLLIQPR